MIIPAEQPLTIYQGATYDKRFTWKAGGNPVDLTGATLRAQVRPSVRAGTTYLDMTTENGQLVIHAAAGGTFGIQLDAETTAALDFSAGVYDLEVEFPGGIVERIMGGPVELSREVTR